MVGYFPLFDTINAYLIYHYSAHTILRIKLGFRLDSSIFKHKIKISLLVAGPEVGLQVKCLKCQALQSKM